MSATRTTAPARTALAHGLRLRATNVNGVLNIDGTQLAVGGYRTGYKLLAPTDDARAWACAAGLWGVSFDRRCDLLAVVAAHIASAPPPAEAPPAAVLRRCGAEGTYATAEGDYEVHPTSEAHRSAFGAKQRWNVLIVGPDQRLSLCWCAPTLRLAAEHIAFKRDRAARSSA